MLVLLTDFTKYQGTDNVNRIQLFQRTENKANRTLRPKLDKE